MNWANPAKIPTASNIQSVNNIGAFQNSKIFHALLNSLQFFNAMKSHHFEKENKMRIQFTNLRKSTNTSI